MVLETTTNNNKVPMPVRREFLFICCRPTAIINLQARTFLPRKTQRTDFFFFHDAISLFMKEREGGGAEEGLHLHGVTERYVTGLQMHA